jgi:thiol-disulfide isomerase/thioredoxin
MTMSRKITDPLALLLFVFIAGCTGESTDPDTADSASNQQPTTQPASQVTEPPASEDPQSAADGLAAPLSFTLTDLDGQPVRAEDYRGKWLVLNYWATWCAPCRDEIPELAAFQDSHDNVQILGIAFEDAEVEKLKNFAADFAVNYPLLTIDVYNPPGFAEEGGLGLPTTIVYDPQGMRYNKHMGPIDRDGLAELIGPESHN